MWSGTSVTDTKKIAVSFNRIFRTIGGMGARDSITKYCNQKKILKPALFCKFLDLSRLQIIMRNTAHPLNSKLKMRDAAARREQNRFRLEAVTEKKSGLQRLFLPRTVTLWNTLPTVVRCKVFNCVELRCRFDCVHFRKTLFNFLLDVQRDT